MRRARLIVPLAALVGVAALPAGAVAAPRAISGTLSRRGYDVIAIAANGRVAVVRAKPGFRLVPPSRTVTLHLRDARGRYAGPIVVGGTSRHAIVGVRAGARLGRVRIGRGFGRARPAASFRVRGRWARAKKGAPIGARRLGRVRTPSRGALGPGLDPDRDGLPGAFDVDDDGDLRLDSVDGAPTRARALGDVPIYPGGVAWIINGGLQVSCLADQMGYTKGVCGYAVNRNAAGPFAGNAEFGKLIDLLMAQRGTLLFQRPAGGGELDCGGLSYCSPGGTGVLHGGSGPFPDSVDADADGRGTMVGVTAFTEGQDGLYAFLVQNQQPQDWFGLLPFAGADAVRAGDTFFEEAEGGNYGTTLNTVFGTLPALRSWSDASRTVTIGYPVPTGAEGSENNAFTVTPQSDGHHRVTLSVWRPQRRAIENSGEGTGWIDMGGLTYSVIGKTAEQNRTVWLCPQSAYSTEDPNLVPAVGQLGLRDTAADAAVDPAHVLTFTVDLTLCLREGGALPGLDRTSTVFVSARSAAGDIAEGVGFSFKNAQPGGPSSSDFGGTWRWAGGSPGTGIEFSASATGGASTSHFLITVYNGLHVTGGTAPAGWTCAPGQAGRAGDSYDCSGATLAPGQTASGAVTLDAPGTAGMSVDLVVCGEGGACQGSGLRYAP